MMAGDTPILGKHHIFIKKTASGGNRSICRHHFGIVTGCLAESHKYGQVVLGSFNLHWHGGSFTTGFHTTLVYITT